MKYLVMLFVLAAMLLCGSCSSDRGDPLAAGDGGSSLSGQNLANATVDNGSSLEFYMTMLNNLFPTYQKGMGAVLSYTGSGSSVNFLGNYSGNAIASISSEDTSEVLVPVLTIQYTNFSNTGKLFYSGSMVFTSTWQGIPAVLHSLILDGTADFAGDWAGSVEFKNMHVGLDSAGNPVDLIERARNPQHNLPLEGDVIINSGGSRINFNPNSVDYPIGGGL